MADAEPLRVLCYNLRYITPADTGERAWDARRDQTAEARIKGTTVILSRIAQRKPAGPVMLTGDLNAAADNPLHAEIKAAGFVDIWQALNADVAAAESGTAHGFTGLTDWARIDYIYASPDWKPVASEIIRSSQNGIYPSDHFPVRATVESAPTEPGPGE